MSPFRSSLSDVQEMIAAVHKCHSVNDNINFYDNWAPNYEQHVGVLEYTAPKLATQGLIAAIPSERSGKLILDVCCGTGLVAKELYRHGFIHFHGVDGSKQMLEIAQQKNLYKDLKQCIVGQEPLPKPAALYDVIMIVGALSEGQVPYTVFPELCTVLKPGGLVCLTVRCNTSNLQYKACLDKELRDLERKGLWSFVSAISAGSWEKATSVEEATPGSEYISGVVYLFRKS